MPRRPTSRSNGPDARVARRWPLDRRSAVDRLESLASSRKLVMQMRVDALILLNTIRVSPRGHTVKE